MGPLSRFGCFVWASCAAALAAAPSLDRVPLRFEENRGQFGPAVRYVARAGEFHLQLTDRGPAFYVGARRVEMRMVHANPAPKIDALEQLGAQTNYLVGNRKDWRTGVANYARLRYHAIYPGVDMVYYGNGGQLEYDFVMQAGANPDAIRMEFTGAESVSVTPEGDLAIEAGGRRVIQKKPAIFQDGKRIAGHYTLLAANQAGVLLGAYDAAKPLVIDPILIYSRYLGSSGHDEITAIKIVNGLLYVTGWTNTSELSTTDDGYQTASGGLTDGFLAIFYLDPNNYLALKYLTYIGGSNNDEPLALEVDSGGFVYLAGTTTSTNFPIVGTSPVQSTGAATTVDGFVCKFDPNAAGGGGLVYSTFLGGATGSETINGIAVDKNGLIYVVGTTRSSDFPVSSGAYAPVPWGPQDAFISVIDVNNSSLVYSTYMGGESSDEGRAIAVGRDGKVYYAATTYSTQFPMEGPSYRNQFQGGIDVVVGVIDITQQGPASMPYSTYFGGSNLDEVRAMALDTNGNLILTGYTFSDDFPITADAVQTKQRNGDAFVSIVNPSKPAQFLVYSTYFGGSQGDVGYAVMPDGAGNIYLAGYTLSPDLFTVGAPQPGSGGGVDMFLAKIRPGVSGRPGILFNTYFGQTGTYVAKTLALGADGSVFAAGYGQNGLPSPAIGYAGGTSDGFLIVVK
jgi:hypothetical protein